MNEKLLGNGRGLQAGIGLMALMLIILIVFTTHSRIAADRIEALDISVAASSNVASIVAANLGEVLGRTAIYARLSTTFLEQAHDAQAIGNPLAIGDAAFLRMAIFDAEGKLAHSSSRRQVEPDLQLFARTVLFSETSPALVIGGIDTGINTHDPQTGWRIPVAVPLISGQRRIGAFAGYIDLGYLLALYKEASLGTRSRIEIIDSRGHQLAEMVDGTMSAGRDLERTGYASFTGGTQLSGTIDARRPGDSGASIGVYRRLDHFPLLVTVTRSRAAVLDELAPRDVKYLIRATLISLLILLASAGLIVLAQRQRRLYAGLTDSEARNLALINQLETEKVRAYQLASLDFLTDIPNRMKFYELAAIELSRARRSRRLTAVFFLDLDKFKVINDTYGHGVGDLLLQQVASRLRLSLRGHDLAARLGGDEFAVLVSDLDSDEAVAIVARKLVASLSEPYPDLDGHDLDITPSIGVALYPGDGEEIDTLLSRADRAMYLAKQGGRGCFRFYEASLNTTSARSAELVSRFARAIRDGEFCLHYQQRVSCTDFRPVGLEALVRWQHPEHGMIFPGEFITLAEEHDCIVALGNHVIDMACAQVANWQVLGLTVLPVAINISARQLRDETLPDIMTACLKKYAIPASLIEIEVTESCFIEQPELAEKVLRALDELGMRISLDDYGTGFSGLSHLKRLPISTVKIDRSFIRDIRNDNSDAVIVSSTISLSHNLGLKVVAEGVETRDQVVHLKTAGCDELQGYYFHRPAAAADITALLRHPSAYAA
ncbi:EAL domain-containing protein [Actimicrobium sp. CCI2.3]|uniref:bifunctional diguanylate cyclase/phosphodiesterase n=1 Tax=Actimicrobium sp. CCI2.3 TaxID=3048616 RepID=UPI002AB3BCCC|nr:EAL domain-containing protein [Actimicrobium sp. CCI2.3]MDY7574890.1 EAL domain-containing protein [Actimicrobium sp. CCI2.3]MEB0023379.1 EAL domain-containing protein [Actimicrobium sp. CCI2.3]